MGLHINFEFIFICMTHNFTAYFLSTNPFCPIAHENYNASKVRKNTGENSLHQS